MIVDIPVRMICPGCISCPDIEIEVVQLEYGGEDKTLYQNKFICKHYNRCCVMNNYLTKEVLKGKVQDEQKT